MLGGWDYHGPRGAFVLASVRGVEGLSWGL